MFTRKQFEHIKRILSKAKQGEALADLVFKVLLGQVELFEESSPDGIDSDLIHCYLTCGERLDLTKQTLQLLTDYSRGKGAEQI